MRFKLFDTAAPGGSCERSIRKAQADIEEQLTGPSWSVAFKNGEATPAALAFAKKAALGWCAEENDRRRRASMFRRRRIARGGRRLRF